LRETEENLHTDLLCNPNPPQTGYYSTDFSQIKGFYTGTDVTQKPCLQDYSKNTKEAKLGVTMKKSGSIKEILHTDVLCNLNKSPNLTPPSYFFTDTRDFTPG
jgi:hypothetical protein